MIKQIIINIIFLFLLYSCKEKKSTVSSTNEAETFSSDINKTDKENFDKYEQILKNYGFKFPSNEVYSQKLKEVFDLHLNDYVGKDFVEIKINKEYEEESNSFPEAVVNKKFIYWDPIPNDDGWDDMAFVCLNKYIFYNDKASFVYLKSKNGNAYLTRLIQYFGYEKDSQLVDYSFEKTAGTLKNSYAYSLFIGRNGVNGKLQLRRELFNKYLEANPNVDIHESRFIENIIGNKKHEGNKESDVAFLLDKIVIQCYNNNSGGIFCGRVDTILLNDRYLREDFRKNKFYNFEELKGYIEKTFEVDFLNQYRKMIKDPDGYTNLRADKNANAKVIEKIKSGSYVEIIDDTGDWWFVEYIEDKKVVEYKQGYVHKSRIVSE